MSRRIGALTIVLTLLGILSGTGQVSAHALEGGFRVLPGHKVQVEAWFETDDAASGASVKVFRPDKQLLAEGKTDKAGIFVFSFGDIEPLEVVIAAGQGHGKTLTISTDALTKPTTDTGRSRTSKPADDSPPVPLLDREKPFPIREVILGITFLLAAAAFAISLRNAQALKRLQDGGSASGIVPPSDS